MATVIAVSFTIVCLTGAGFAVFVARSTRGGRPDIETDQHTLREREKTWFMIVIVLLIALLVATIAFTPYGRSAGRDAQIVNVVAQQFAWTIPSTSIKAGRQVEFKLTSRDVNHSFAVYTAGGKLLFQVQVMPGSTTDYVYTFKHPGTYHVLCLEYCGVGHAGMQSELTVVA